MSPSVFLPLGVIHIVLAAAVAVVAEVAPVASHLAHGQDHVLSQEVDQGRCHTPDLVPVASLLGVLILLMTAVLDTKAQVKNR